MIEVELHDGTILEIATDDPAVATRAAQKYLGKGGKPEAPPDEGISAKLAKAWENPPQHGLISIAKDIYGAAKGGKQAVEKIIEGGGLDEEGRLDPKQTTAPVMEAMFKMGPGALNPARPMGATVGALATRSSQIAPEMAAQKLARDAAESVAAQRVAPEATAPAATSVGISEIDAAAAELGRQVPRILTEGPMMQRLGAGASQSPFFGNQIPDAVGKLGAGLGDDVAKVAASLGKGTPDAAGSAIRGGVDNWVTKASQAAEDVAWAPVNAAMAPKAGVSRDLFETLGAASAINAKRANAGLGPSPLVKMVEEAVTRPGGLDYDGIKMLRSEFGGKNAAKFAKKSYDTSEVKALYSSLSRDTENVVRELAGAGVVDDWRRAVRLSKLANAERSRLQSIFGRNKSDEEMYHKLASLTTGKRGKDDRTVLLAAKAMGPKAWQEFQAAKLRSLGRRSPADDFNPSGFSAAWRDGTSDTFKRMMRPEHRKALDAVATLTGAMDEKVGRFVNTSRTAGTAVGYGTLAGMAVAPLQTLAAMIPGALVGRWLAQPRSAAAVARWAKTVEQAQRLPSRQTAAIMQQANRRLAVVVAGVSGDKPALILQKLNVGMPGGSDQQQNL